MKRFISVLLCACLLCAALIPAASAADTASAEILSRLGLFKGTGTGLALDDTVTRAQAVTMLVRFLGAEQDALAAPGASGFADSASHWAEPYIAYAHAHGITNGTSDTTFSPDEPVTGPQLTRLILSALGYEGVTLSNAYSKGIEAQLLTNNTLKAAAVSTSKAPLVRGTLAEFFHAALLAKNADGVLVYKTLIEKGVFTQEQFDAAALCVCSSAEKERKSQ